MLANSVQCNSGTQCTSSLYTMYQYTLYYHYVLVHCTLCTSTHCTTTMYQFTVHYVLVHIVLPLHIVHSTSTICTSTMYYILPKYQSIVFFCIMKQSMFHFTMLAVQQRFSQVHQSVLSEYCWLLRKSSQELTISNRRLTQQSRRAD